MNQVPKSIFPRLKYLRHFKTVIIGNAIHLQHLLWEREQQKGQLWAQVWIHRHYYKLISSSHSYSIKTMRIKVKNLFNNLWMPLFKKKLRKGIQTSIFSSHRKKINSKGWISDLMRAKIPLKRRKSIEDPKREELTL